MKITTRLRINSIVFTFLICASFAVPAATIKCWTNKEGIRECGTTVPPEYAQEGHEEINAQGRVIKETKRAKTPAEIAQEEKAKAEEMEKKKKQEEQARQDKVLLDTYTSVGDIEKFRDDNIRVIESRVTLTKSRIEKTQADLDKRIQAAANAERDGKKPNAALLQDIDILRNRIKDNKAFIADREKEIADVKAKYNADIERFKQLKNQ